MIRQVLSKINEKGSLLVEAMAMLGLIAMVTPILYKKAAERTAELQDINAAGEVRSLIRATDDFLKDNYAAITEGRTVVVKGNDGEDYEFDFGTFAGAGAREGVVNITSDDFLILEKYLPYGFLDADGKIRPSKTFEDYEVAIKMVTDGTPRRTSLTGFVQAKPANELPPIRASRLASMIGSNGGFANEDNRAQGVQGIWEVDDIGTNLNLDVHQGDIVAASIQPINSSVGGELEDVLYRKLHNNDIKHNSMETTLYMGHKRIDEINQLIVTADGDDMISELNDGEVEKDALLIRNKGGASIEGRISAAMTNFLVDPDGNVAIGNTAQGYTTEVTGEDPDVTPTTGNLTIEAATGNLKTIGSVTAKTGLLVGDDTPPAEDEEAGTFLTVDESGNLETGGTAKIIGQTVTGTARDLTITRPENLYADKTSEDSQLVVWGNAFIDGILEIWKLRAHEIDTGVLRAGTPEEIDWNNLEDADFTMRVTPEVEAGEDGTGGEGGYLYTKGLRAGNEYASPATVTDNINDIYPYESFSKTSPLEVTNDDNSDVYMHLDNENSIIHGSNSTGRELFLFNDKVSRIATVTEQDGIARIGTGLSEITIPGGEGEEDTTINQIGATIDVTRGTANANLNLNPDAITSIISNSRANNGVSAYTVMKQGSIETMVGKDTTNVKVNIDADDVNGRASFKVDIKTWAGDESVDTTKNLGNIVNGENPIFSIINDTSRADRGTVNIRKGVVELLSKHEADLYRPENESGYVQADRFIANKKLESAALPQFGVQQKKEEEEVPYDSYQVNPAYTSVMHDIKLTTRGGARLSDILPDFINKGIYVVVADYDYNAIDDIYKDNSTKAELAKCSSGGSGGSGGSEGSGGSGGCTEVSPWVGFVPKPQCPPNYAMVATIHPTTWAMSQAGVPFNYGTDEAPVIELEYNYDPTISLPNIYEEEDGLSPLYFQKSTWLKSDLDLIIPSDNEDGTSGGSFKGWNAIIGFIYPQTLYQSYITRASLEDSAAMGDDVFYWNLFPVGPQEIEGYTTVYCYFDRGNGYDGEYVDQYDQLGNYKQEPENYKADDYRKRLNDPSGEVKYNSIW